MAREKQLARKPANLSFEQAAVVPVSASTAHQAVFDKGRVEAGQKVLVIGASGGVGSYAVQLAKASGAQVTGVCSTSKVDLVRSLGADHVIDYTREDFADGVHRYDLVLDIGGNQSISHLRRALTPTGTLVFVGGEEGGNFSGGMSRPMRAAAMSMFLRQRLAMFVATTRAGGPRKPHRADRGRQGDAESRACLPACRGAGGDASPRRRQGARARSPSPSEATASVPPGIDRQSRNLDGGTGGPYQGTVDLTRDQLVAMHPYVIDIPDGRLAEGPSRSPTSVKDFKTTKADVDAIFDTFLPSFIAGRDLPVPLVVWAHGGLVDKAAGLGVANLQIEWWKANGAFPVHFVWETGLAASLWDAVKDSLPGRSRGLVEEAKDKAIEVVVRAVPAARATWGAMKTTAALASEEEQGGAWYFATKLGEFVKANPGAITVHTAGHSAGSIFHSHLIPEILAAGVPSIASLDLLRPCHPRRGVQRTG